MPPSPRSSAPAEGQPPVSTGLPVPHTDLLHATTRVLAHYYPASSDSTNVAGTAAAARVLDSSEDRSVTCKSGSTAVLPPMGVEEDSLHTAPAEVNATTPRPTVEDTREMIDELGSSCAASYTQWGYMDLPFLSVAEQLGTSAQGTASDDADEHTPMQRLLMLLVRLAIPVILTQLMRVSMSFVTTVFMGHYLTTIQFGAAATGLTFTTLSALSIGAGFASALDTLATQEHGRRPHSPEIAALLLRSVICTFVTYLPIAVLYFFCEPLLRVLIHPDLVADTAYFLRMSIFIAAPMMLVGILLRFAQSQRVTQLGLVSTTAGLITLPPLLLIFRSYAIAGVIMALTLNRMLTLVIIVALVLRHPGLRQCWTGRTLREHLHAVLTDVPALIAFTKTGFPVMAAYCADTWSFEVLGVAAAYLGATSAAVWNVVMMVYEMIFCGYIGLAAAGSIRIGNAMGRGKGLLARKYSYALAIVSACVTVVVASVVWGYGGVFFRYMQKDDTVTAVGESMTGAMALTFVFDSVFYAMQGASRGAGYNGILFVVVMVGLWGVAVPVGIVLAIPLHYGVHGLMYGLAAGVMLCCPMQLGFLWYFLPWEKQAAAIGEHPAEEED